MGPGALHKDEDVPGMALVAEPGIEMWDEAIPALLWVFMMGEELASPGKATPCTSAWFHPAATFPKQP